MKVYLGDAVYADFDGGIILTTEDGVRVTNTVYLEPEVYTALTKYVDAQWRELHGTNNRTKTIESA